MSRSLANGTGDFRDCQRKNSSTRCLQLLDETHGAPKNCEKNITETFFLFGVLFFVSHFFFRFFFAEKKGLVECHFGYHFALDPCDVIPIPYRDHDRNVEFYDKILLMVQKSGDHQSRLVVYPIIYRVLTTIPGGCLGFLNHQQYYAHITCAHLNGYHLRSPKQAECPL